MSRMAKTKGASGEREFCKWIYENLGLEKTRNLDQTRDGGSDILDVFGIDFEIKRCETLNMDSWWAQVIKATRKRGNEPVVAFRQNRKKWRFLISAKHLGLENGYIILSERIFINWVAMKNL